MAGAAGKYDGDWSRQTGHPADSFIPRITPERYQAWLQLAADGNMVMLRIWGGGLYEEDVFYDTCDELGLLVWQDFMFGCGIYPAQAEFQASVRAEAETALRRLRHHPSIVLWAGNNEDYSIAHSSCRGKRAWRRTSGYPVVAGLIILFGDVALLRRGKQHSL